MSSFKRWMVHRCSVDTPTGPPDRWGTAPVVAHRDVPCLIDGGEALVRTSESRELVGALKVSVELEHADWFPIGAAVTARGRRWEVKSIDIVDDKPRLNGATMLLQ